MPWKTAKRFSILGYIGTSFPKFLPDLDAAKAIFLNELL